LPLADLKQKIRYASFCFVTFVLPVANSKSQRAAGLARVGTADEGAGIGIDENRVGDHICYYSDLRKLREHFPEWRITKSLPDIFQEIVRSWIDRLAAV